MSKVIRLPQPSDDVSLSKYGYMLKKSAAERQKALKKASKEIPLLAVERRVNLVRNLSRWNDKNYSKLSKDVEFLKKEYAKQKKKKTKTK